MLVGIVISNETGYVTGFKVEWDDKLARDNAMDRLSESLSVPNVVVSIYAIPDEEVYVNYNDGGLSEGAFDDDILMDEDEDEDYNDIYDGMSGRLSEEYKT